MIIGSEVCTMKKALSVILIITLLFLTGCAGNDSLNEQRLHISAVADPETRIQIPMEDLKGNFDSDLCYQNVKDVTITLDKQTYPLEDAIADGLITVEELMAYARIDARNGFCTEIADSRNGVSHFIYRYQGICDLYFTHDIYETPDGKNHVLNYFSVYNNGGTDNTFYTGPATLYSVLDQNYPIDQEDWKLKFEITDASSTGFTLNVHQADSPIKQFRSQHVGQLRLGSIDLFNLETLDSYLYCFDGEESPIQANAPCTYQINFADFEESPGTLPSGSYRIFLDIYDDFDEADMHPLTRDYRQAQGYWISFDIP